MKRFSPSLASLNVLGPRGVCAAALLMSAFWVAASTRPAAADAPEQPADASTLDEVEGQAEEVEVTPAAPIEPAPNHLQLELTTGALFGRSLGALSFSYERLITDFLSVRIGYGVTGGLRKKFGEGGGSRSRIHGHGGYAMVNGLIGETHKLELGAGVAVISHNRRTSTNAYETIESDGVFVTPQFSVAYRYQPPGSGFFYRFGFMWTLQWGLPIGGSVGYAF